MESIEYRGVLTPEIKEKAEVYLHRDFSQKELRLYPYLQYCCINSEPVDWRKIDGEEKDIIDRLDIDGLLVWDCTSRIIPTREFWNFMCDIITDGYVKLLTPKGEKT